MIKPFMELTEDEFDTILKEKIKNNPEYTFDELAVDYPQPIWRSYPHAIAGVMGCWSLTGFMVKNEQYCLNCDCYITRLDRGVK